MKTPINKKAVSSENFLSKAKALVKYIGTPTTNQMSLAPNKNKRAKDK